MKQAILSILVLFFSIIVWLHWGGLSSDMGTLIIMITDAFILSVIADNTGKKSEKNVKE